MNIFLFHRQPCPGRPNRPDRRAAGGALLVLLLAALTLAGCLSKPALRKETFLISAPAGATNAPQLKFNEGIQLRAVSVAAPFAGRSLVYRTSDTAYEVDPYAEFLVAPERMLDAAIRQWLHREGIFRFVLEADSATLATHYGEVQVTEFHGDLRPGREPVAVIALRFTMSARGSVAVLSADVRSWAVVRQVPLRGRTAAAVAEGLQRAFDEALADLKKQF